MPSTAINNSAIPRNPMPSTCLRHDSCLPCKSIKNNLPVIRVYDAHCCEQLL